MNPKVGQRYRYNDSAGTIVLEIVKMYMQYNEDFLDIKVLQLFPDLCRRKLKTYTEWQTRFGTWDYLEGQDAPL